MTTDDFAKLLDERLKPIEEKMATKEDLAKLRHPHIVRVEDHLNLPSLN